MKTIIEFEKGEIEKLLGISGDMAEINMMDDGSVQLVLEAMQQAEHKLKQEKPIELKPKFLSPHMRDDEFKRWFERYSGDLSMIEKKIGMKYSTAWARAKKLGLITPGKNMEDKNDE